jgi:hypothetical protein
MTLDASGNLGVGTTSPSTYGKFVAYSSGGYFAVDTNGQVNSFQLLDTASAGGKFSGSSNVGLLGAIHIEQTTTGSAGGYIGFRTSPSGSTTPIERARINSAGAILLGCSTAPNPGGGSTASGFAINGIDNDAYISHKIDNGPLGYFRRDGTDGDVFQFRKGSTTVGSISVTTSATAYNTSSDYRLKNTITPMTGALAKVALLKPCTYKWNADGSDGEGFIAHELAEVCPLAVTGVKDAVDADGNPQYQGIDVSFLVATLTAAIQEQQAIIELLKARLDAANL